MEVLTELLMGIITTFFDVIINILSILPGSPFIKFIEDLSGFEFLSYMNYFIPFYLFATIIDVYIGAIFAYYVYKYVRKFINFKNGMKAVSTLL